MITTTYDEFWTSDKKVPIIDVFETTNLYVSLHNPILLANVVMMVDVYNAGNKGLSLL